MTKQNATKPTRSTTDPLIPLRTLTILTASVLVGAITALISYAQWHQASQALGLGALSALGCARQLHTWTGT
jgi:ABC-type transporter Mla maintaining outer membrane lipid asymmetry permease subunit MlaE